MAVRYDSSPDLVQGRLLKWAALFIVCQGAALTLSPAETMKRERRAARAGTGGTGTRAEEPRREEPGRGATEREDER